MKASVAIFSDYVCPFCYVGKKLVDRMEEELKTIGVDLIIDWRPYILRPPELNIPLPTQEYLDASWGNVTRIAEDYGVDIKKPPKRSNSSLALQAALFVKTSNPTLFKQLHSKIFDAYFQQGLDIGEINTILEIASEIGLDTKILGENLSKPTYKQQLLELRTMAESIGIYGVPTFIIGGRPLVGAQPIEILMAAVTETFTPN